MKFLKFTYSHDEYCDPCGNITTRVLKDVLKIDLRGALVVIIQPQLETNQRLYKLALNNLVRLTYGSRGNSHLKKMGVLVGKFEEPLRCIKILFGGDRFKFFSPSYQL